MSGLVVRWLVIFLAVPVAASLLPGYVNYSTYGGVALFAAILALLNLFVKPLLAVLTAPISCLTLGLFIFVINAFLFWLAAQVTGGGAVQVNGAPGALIGSLIVSIVSVVAARVMK